MVWLEFITYLEKNNASPTVLPVLRRSSLVKTSASECVVECESLGAKNFLDGKKKYIEEALFDFTREHLTAVFVVSQKKSRSKKQTKELPLLEYQNKTERTIRESGLLARYTFENFAVSNSNHIAHAAARAVSERPGLIYNPLFIYGDVGVGKTHLSQATANNILKQDNTKRVLYCTSEEFTNDLVESIRQKNTKKTRSKYRHLDVLVVDDIQFIAGKSYVQEEFYHTFNSIVGDGGQVILSSDRPPKEIKELEDRLRSRFSGGLTIDMQKPDFELRTAILLIKAQERNISIDMSAAQSLAENVRDTRELEGALLKMLSLAIAENKDVITLESTKQEFTNRREKTARRVPPQDVIRTVSSFYNVKQSDIKGPSRVQNIALARQVCMYILRSLFNLNHVEIAFLLHRKDHTTIMHGVNKISELVMKDDRFKDNIEAITSQLI